MFKWYRRAELCVVHLADVPSNRDDGADSWMTEMEQSEWFTRGWTLQELLAPETVAFCNRSWEVLGFRMTNHDNAPSFRLFSKYAYDISEETFDLEPLVASITGISTSYLNSGPDKMMEASIACKMSWAANRKTTRPEDMAYCLLGIFDVNMPLLYGEGEGAFRRLQEEIVRRSNDQSIFAWWKPSSCRSVQRDFAILAPSPLYFADGGQIERCESETQRPYAVTNLGLDVSFPVQRFVTMAQKAGKIKADPIYILKLDNCVRTWVDWEGRRVTRSVEIALTPISGSGQMKRIWCDGFAFNEKCPVQQRESVGEQRLYIAIDDPKGIAVRKTASSSTVSPLQSSQAVGFVRRPEEACSDMKYIN